MPTRRAVCILSLLNLTIASAVAQAPDDVMYSRHRQFRIPFNLGSGAERLRQLQLFYSTDEGRTWHASSVAAPSEKYFHFTCERDGLYWFTVQTLDKQGNLYPASLKGARPNLKVVVDTLPPVVRLRALPRRGQQIGVDWDIREENLDYSDPRSIRLEYRDVGAVRWTPLTINRLAGRHQWYPESQGPWEVRMLVLDRAGNLAEAKIRIDADGRDAPIAATPRDRQPSPRPGAVPEGYAEATNRRIVNSKDLVLNCEIDDVGPSGVSELELWYTTDGRSWSRYPLDASAIRDDTPGMPGSGVVGERRKLRKRIEFTVDREGVYGFTILAKSGVGRSRRPPRVGEPPQVWIEVDTTEPVVAIKDVQVRRGIEKGQGQLTITWSAFDKNLARDPIRISYAKDLSGPWNPIVTDIPNTGSYTWNIPENMLYQFYVKVEARDAAGNVGEDTTREMVKVDLSQPRVNILGVEPKIGGVP